MLSLKQLRSAATEINRVLGCDPPIDIDGTVDEIVLGIRTASTLIEPTDFFSKSTKVVIDELSPIKTPTAEEPEPEEKKAEVLKEETPDDLDEEEDDYDVLEQIAKATQINDLKKLVKDNDKFKSLRKHLTSYKSIDILRTDMEETIGVGATAAYVNQGREDPVIPVVPEIKLSKIPYTGSKTKYYEVSSVNPEIKLGVKVKFISAGNSRVAPRDELVGTVDRIKTDPKKSANEVVRISTHVGKFYKTTKSITIIKE